MIDGSQILTAFIEHGVLGTVAGLAVWALWKRDRMYLKLHEQYTAHLLESSSDYRDITEEVTAAIKDLNEACADCPYRLFMENFRENGEDDDGR